MTRLRGDDGARIMREVKSLVADEQTVGLFLVRVRVADDGAPEAEVLHLTGCPPDQAARLACLAHRALEPLEESLDAGEAERSPLPRDS